MLDEFLDDGPEQREIDLHGQRRERGGGGNGDDWMIYVRTSPSVISEKSHDPIKSSSLRGASEQDP